MASLPSSPVTGVIDENLVIIDFGKYEGRSVHDIAEVDPEFYERLKNEKEKGAFVAVSDNMKLVHDQIAPWVPGGLMSLGTDGFGRSDTRKQLRRFFEIDAEMTVIATLYQLAEQGKVDRKLVAKAIKDLDVNPDKVFPQIV